jgi:uncharacterized membrane protein
MNRDRDRLVATLGEERFKMAKTLYYWGNYLLIGKLSDVTGS